MLGNSAPGILLHSYSEFDCSLSSQGRDKSVAHSLGRCLKGRNSGSRRWLVGDFYQLLQISCCFRVTNLDLDSTKQLHFPDSLH